MANRRDPATLIQEVVDHPDRHEGNALVLLLSGSGGWRDVVTVVSYDGVNHRLERAARLYIERRRPIGRVFGVTARLN